MNAAFIKTTIDSIVTHYNTAMALGIAGEAELANDVLTEIDELIASVYCQLGFPHAKEIVLG